MRYAKGGPGPGSKPRDAGKRFDRLTHWADPPEVNPDLGPCLIHMGASNGGGYAQFTWDGAGGYAHRFAWERAYGPIPPAMTIDHLCEVRRCVNPEHLRLATGVDNYLRTKLAKKTCPNGHEYTTENTATRAGRRNCIQCRKATSQRGTECKRASRRGDPDKRVRYDQAQIRGVLDQILAGGMRIADGAREVGCNPNYLSRRAWAAARQRVLARDDGLCILCLGSPAEDVHHRQPRGSGGSADPARSFGSANLVSLCRMHHAYIESHREWALERGYLVSRYADPANVAIYTPRQGWAVLTPDARYEQIEWKDSAP